MYLYFNYSESGSLRWYVKVSRKGRRIGISEEYGTPAFDAAYEAGVAALGGVMRVRRVKATVKPDQPERRYLYVDVSQRGQVRYYVQLRNKLPKIRIKAEFGTPESEAEVDAAIATQIALYGNEGDYINAQKQRNEARPALPTTTPQPGTLRRPLAGRSLRRPGRTVGLDPAAAQRADRESATREWREAVCGADAQGHSGGDEGAHPVAGRQPVVGAARHDPLDDR
jgi:hypothetical protein